MAKATDATAQMEVDDVVLARDGDAEAFSRLVRSYQRRAVSVAYRLLSNIEDATDVAQDAFVRAYRNLGQLEDPTRFGPWLMRVVSNLSLNYRRSRAAKKAYSLDELAGDGTEGDGGIDRLESKADLNVSPQSEELHAAISAGMERLPDKQRLALILFSVEGMAQKEVAEILECSVELVKWNVFQARKKLREMLDSFL